MTTNAPQRNPAAYRRDLHLARQVVGRLRDEALGTGEAFHVGDLALERRRPQCPLGRPGPGGLPLLGRGILPPVHGVQGGSPADRQKAPLWKFWGAG